MRIFAFCFSEFKLSYRSLVAKLTAHIGRATQKNRKPFLYLFWVFQRLAQHSTRQRITDNAVFLASKRFYLQNSTIYRPGTKHAFRTL